MKNNNWVFGNGAGLRFSTSPPTAIGPSAMRTEEGCTSVSDKNGNLLFYTDGGTVWDSAHTVRVTGLKGNYSSSQSAIIVPSSSNDDQYYIFTTDGYSGGNNHFDGGLLDVSAWAFTPLSSLMTMPSTKGLSPVEKVTAIQHENCRDFWVITLLQKGEIDAPEGESFMRIFKVDSTGVQHHSDTVLAESIRDLGYMKASPDGKNIAIANFQDNDILVFPFNNATGVLDTSGNFTVTTVGTDNYGIEFSPNNQFLYYSEILVGNIHQVDLTNPSSSAVVGVIPGLGGALQLGPDNVIYLAKYMQKSVGAITNPDVAGIGCNVDASYVTLLDGTESTHGLPNLIANTCKESEECGCSNCNESSKEDNRALKERADQKHNFLGSSKTCYKSYEGECNEQILAKEQRIQPCFYFHWGDGANDRIEEHDTEVFYISICNKFKDVKYKGLKILSVSLVPNDHPLESIHIVPDRLISIDCLEPCSCVSREFAIITRAHNIAGKYALKVDYCFEEIALVGTENKGSVQFPVEITED